MAQPDEERGGRRQRQQHAGEAEQLSEREEREDHGERMQPDAIADEIRHQHVRLEQLADAVHGEHGEESGPARPLQQRGENAEHEPQAEPDVRNEHQQTGQDADRQRTFQAGQPQRDRVVDGEHEHHHQLAAQEFGQHRSMSPTIVRTLPSQSRGTSE